VNDLAEIKRIINFFCSITDDNFFERGIEAWKDSRHPDEARIYKIYDAKYLPDSPEEAFEGPTHILDIEWKLFKLNLLRRDAWFS
jgi:hypothetical protein